MRWLGRMSGFRLLTGTSVPPVFSADRGGNARDYESRRALESRVPTARHAIARDGATGVLERRETLGYEFLGIHNPNGVTVTGFRDKPSSNSAQGTLTRSPVPGAMPAIRQFGHGGPMKSYHHRRHIKIRDHRLTTDALRIRGHVTCSCHCQPRWRRGRHREDE